MRRLRIGAVAIELLFIAFGIPTGAQRHDRGDSAIAWPNDRYPPPSVVVPEA